MKLQGQPLGILSTILPISMYIYFPQAVTLLFRQKSAVILSSAHFLLIPDTNAHIQSDTRLGSPDNCKVENKRGAHGMMKSCIVGLVKCQQLVAAFASHEN